MRLININACHIPTQYVRQGVGRRVEAQETAGVLALNTPTLAPGTPGLPVTGANPVGLAAAGFLMVGLGLAALLVRRSR